MRRSRLPAALTIVAATTSACATEVTPSVLDPSGEEAATLAGLWWLIFGLGAAVCVGFTAAIVMAALRGANDEGRRRSDTSVVVLVGVVVPGVVLAVVAAATITVASALRAPDADPGTLTVEVVGHRWWWEVRYPELGVETANHLHLPVDRPVVLRLLTADVIHSFWVPQLAGKLDLVPGTTNTLPIRVEEAGAFWGLCAEFCGLQHANMRLRVVGEEPAAFERWIDARRAGPPPAADAAARRGAGVFDALPCGGCHRVELSPDGLAFGPDLGDLGSRSHLGAGAVENTPQNLAAWIRDPHRFKSGVNMAPFDVPDEDLAALVAYLESLDP